MPPKIREVLEALNNNRRLKVASLLLAVLSWYAIRETTNFEALIKNVVVKIQTDEGWAVLDRSVEDVEVLFRGAPQDIRFLNRDQIFVVVDVRGMPLSGPAEFELGPKLVKAPGGAKPIRVEPSVIRFSLDQESDRQLPVSAELVGTLPEGLEVERVVCDPASVTIHGAALRIAAVDSLSTEEIDLAGRARSFELTREIVSPGSDWTARLEPDRVRVSVQIIERTSQREMGEIPVATLLTSGSDRSAVVKPKSVKIVVAGESSVLAGLSASDVRPFVDCTGLTFDAPVELPVRVPQATGWRVLTIEPAAVRVERGGGS